ncbi:hypothetical protein EPA93_42225 [Ktedonosporobacter rubrisoli]|uniref:VCBS repeat-containing protein n=1 Tax=Ktedonosporobacter rubrisoli TaxID=2509675 RepID=A0A4P6K221_KTERU|nr:hypothetical protein [Ktedonosporobacter rubrisoli]QBD82247.1 hypothetical protein EPA93_42225 [Ktedonosporobacter rubrisoli]
MKPPREQHGVPSRFSRCVPVVDLDTPAATHEVGHYVGVHPEDQPYSTGDMVQHRQQRQYSPVQSDALSVIDLEDEPRMRTSVRRYHTQQIGVQSAPRTMIRVHHHPVPARATRIQSTSQTLPHSSLYVTRAHFPLHWLFYAGIALMFMLIGWIGLGLLTSWWQGVQDDWQYGHPRTFQIDAVVGHHDSTRSPSHFTVWNLKGRLVIVEFPAGDVTHATICVGPVLTGVGQDQIPATLQFKDVNHDGKPDMIVSVRELRYVFINENGSFRPLKPGEAVQMEKG